jgi:hypothetical protein
MRSHTSGAGTGSGSSVVTPPPFDMADAPLPLPAKCSKPNTSLYISSEKHSSVALIHHAF